MVGRSDEGFNYTAIRLQLPTCTTEECKARHAVLKKMRIPWSDLDMKLLADVVKSRIPQPKGPRNPAWGRLLPFSSAVPQAHVRRNRNLFDRQRLGEEEEWTTSASGIGTKRLSKPICFRYDTTHPYRPPML